MIDFNNMLEKARKATLSISDNDNRICGSAVVIAPGFAITNRHVVKNEACLVPVVKVSSYEEVFEASLVKACRTIDLAFIKIPVFLPSINVLDEAKPMLGEDIYVIGFSAGISERTVTRGIISKKEIRFEQCRYIQFDAPIYGGNSGGPLINKQGCFLGIVSRGVGGEQIASTLNLAIPWGVIQNKVRYFIDEGYSENGKMCLTCGWHNKNEIYCKKCGSQLPAENEISSYQMTEYYDKCPICEKKRHNNNNYCKVCGKFLIKEADNGTD